MRVKYAAFADTLSKESRFTINAIRNRSPISSKDDVPMINQGGEFPSLLYLRSFRLFGKTDLSELGEALASDHLDASSLALVMRATATAVSFSGMNPACVATLFEPHVPKPRIAELLDLVSSFNPFSASSDFSIPDPVLGICDDSFTKILSTLISFRFRRKIDRILIVGSAISAFDETLRSLEMLPLPNVGPMSAANFYVCANAKLVSRLAHLIDVGSSNLDSDLLNALQSRFDPDLLCNLSPTSRAPDLPYFDDSISLLPSGYAASFHGYRGVSFDIESAQRSPSLSAVALCAFFAFASGYGLVPPDPAVLRLFSDFLSDSKRPNTDQND